MTAKPQTTWRPMFGIVNAQGKPWTARAWFNAAEARDYLKLAAKEMPELKLRRHRVVPVSLTIRVRAAR